MELGMYLGYYFLCVGFLIWIFPKLRPTWSGNSMCTLEVVFYGWKPCSTEAFSILNISWKNHRRWSRIQVGLVKSFSMLWMLTQPKHSKHPKLRKLASEVTLGLKEFFRCHALHVAWLFRHGILHVHNLMEKQFIQCDLVEHMVHSDLIF